MKAKIKTEAETRTKARTEKETRTNIDDVENELQTELHKTRSIYGSKVVVIIAPSFITKSQGLSIKRFQ